MEFIKIISLAHDFTPDIIGDIIPLTHFSDVQKWSLGEKYLSFAYEMGWIDNSESFRPNEAITLSEAQDILDAINGEESSLEVSNNGGITKETWVTMIVDQLGIR